MRSMVEIAQDLYKKQNDIFDYIAKTNSLYNQEKYWKNDGNGKYTYLQEIENLNIHFYKFYFTNTKS